jgi:hypothetical protein
MKDNENNEVESKKESKFNAFVEKHGKKKIILGASCIVIVAALTVGLSVGITACNNGGSKIEVVTGSTPVFSEDNKTCTYGIYPQTHVSDETTIKALNALTKTESNGWYLYNNYYYAKTVVTLDDYDDENLKFSDGTPINNGDTCWFRCDLIKWNVIKTSNDTYTLLSSLLLQNHIFDKEEENANTVNYKTSDVREWLNADFYNSAFSDNAYIQTTEVDNSPSTTGETENSYACENTFDKVYLLSYLDYMNADYGFSTSKDESPTRILQPTDYATACGAATFASESETDDKNVGMFMTRSITGGYGEYFHECWCNYDGEMNTHYEKWYDNRLCVQPAITISKTK